MSELSVIINSIKALLETEQLAGLTDIVTDVAGSKKKEGTMKAVEKEDMLKKLMEKAAGCKGCSLYKKRTNLVFGSGDPNARLMFVGEAPGHDEDLKGLPFVGRAGTLLTKMIEAITMKREDVYIANVLKCRPPGNRNPLPEEIVSCSSILSEQIEIIRPKVICPLGKFAAQYVLKSTQPITVLRGKFHDYNGCKVMPTYHPAYLLRNPREKRSVWEDLKKIRDEIKKK